MRHYSIFHENKRIGLFAVTESGEIVDVQVNYNPYTVGSLPLGVVDSKTMSSWLKSRSIPVTRQCIDVDLHALGLSSTFELMLQNYGLSLVDHYWFCEHEAEFTWESINAYNNFFQSTYSLDLKDDLSTVGGKTNFVPSASLKGDLKKKWIIDNNGVRRLVKGNYNNTCRQSISEALATKIHKGQGVVSYTPYSLIDISSDNQSIIGCECPNFTTISTEFLSAYDIITSYENYISKKPNSMSYYEYYIWICSQQGLDIRRFMEYQIVTDFIITNTDRHFNNFGIIRDSHNLQWLMPAPIFDSGNSMFYNSSYIPVGKALLDIDVTAFLNKEVKLLRYVKDRGLVNLSILPDDNNLYNLLSVDHNTSAETNERLVKAYNRKIRYLEDFQNGADIWSYKYKG